jgi:azurin
MRRSRLWPVAALVLLTACSAAGGEQVAAAPIVATDGVVAITGSDQIRWNSERITADTGELTFELTCGRAVNHNLVIDGETIAECAPGQTATGTASLEPGEHEFLCTVPGHARSMRGTLAVG